MRIIGQIVAVCALATIAGIANASVTYTTFTGVVTSGFDYIGEFGASNTNLAGAKFVATYQINDANTNCSYDPNVSICDSGLYFGNGHVSTVATLAINGKPTVPLGVFESEIVQTNGGGSSVQNYADNQEFIATGGYLTLLRNVIISSSNGIPADFHTPFTYIVEPGDKIAGGLFQDYFRDYATGVVTTFAYADLQIVSVTSSGTAPVPVVTGSVPEPAQWALLIVGFGLIGAALRFRRSTSESDRGASRSYS